MKEKKNNLKALFKPKSIAIIGATPNIQRIGGRPLHYLKKNNYQGQIFPINPKYDEIDGLPCYKEITEIDSSIDLAIISLPSKLVLENFKKCVKKKVRSVVIFSSGFSEVNKEGEEIEHEIASIAKKHGIRVLGPNSLGMFNVNQSVYATFSTILQKQTPLKGNIGFVSQSGAFGSHVYTLARENLIGFSHFIATGNESDIDVADCIDFLADDEDTDVIACYIEGAKNGEKLRKAFQKASINNKPVVALKVGKTDVGKMAALSHTGSLAGADEMYDTIFKQYGVYRAETIDEFLDVIHGCSLLPFPKGDKTAIFTVSGGVGILMADQLSEKGLSVPETPGQVQENLKEILPLAGVKNPIDTTAEINTKPNLLEDFMDNVLSSGEYDSALIFLAFSGLYEDMIKKRITSLNNMSKKHKNIPMITVTLNNQQTKKTFKENDLMLIEDPSRAITVMKALNYFNQHFNEQPVSDDLSQENRKVIHFKEGASVLTEYESKKALREYKLPITKEKLAKNATEAMEYAKDIGYPVALKGMSPQILHKTDRGLVQLNIQDEESLNEKFQFIKKQIELTENADFEGVLVQEMLSGDLQEMYIGSKKDPVFGQMLFVGMGGVYIEVLKDIAIRKAPVSTQEAKKMIDELKGNVLLNGYRGKPRYDIQSLTETISTFSQFIAEHSKEVGEIDLNPVMVYQNEGGVKIADALITLEQTEETSNEVSQKKETLI